jgi:hypothetical protein
MEMYRDPGQDTAAPETVSSLDAETIAVPSVINGKRPLYNQSNHGRAAVPGDQSSMLCSLHFFHSQICRP